MKKAGIRIFFTSYCLLLIGLLTSEDLLAQRNELGFGLGGATYTGDIIRKVDPSQLGIQGTLFGRRNFDNVWSLRAGISFARLNAADSINPIDAAAAYRNAGFKGSVFEATAVMEYHFLDFTHPQSQYRYSPYGFFGLGYSFFSGEGQTYQGDPNAGDYSLGTPIIPFGLGIKYKLNDRWTLAMELGFRATFSDLFDKIDSKNANIPRFPDPSNQNVPYGINYGSYGDKDWYYFLGLTLSYSFNSVQCYSY
ncbi:hypothetical protein P872_03205 [Rhodonellum psychrophilum GCM71 = DSM 17998]|uniref:DUF6089 domain-containing protein n=2 Tax=Rhodonellum TaxID=336827 RepID=U5C604_9BACT|nr:MULTISPECIES: DUF6089 family protein [Rhodonellum]ERM83647.1 hypothetical protein P872_03205 [Rhodonellum psychrophilum GCM71 = DSM 17998]SDY50730.1 Outer membrane protein beta-barrel domain-containing protein [Rhodonellum ikkaensis]